MRTAALATALAILASIAAAHPVAANASAGSVPGTPGWRELVADVTEAVAIAPGPVAASSALIWRRRHPGEELPK